MKATNHHPRANTRHRKPKPLRTHPIRGNTPSGDSNGTVKDASNATRSPSSDPITSGVELGYRVVREYLRQGERVARQLWSPPAASGGDARSESTMLLERTMRSVEDLAAAFGDIVRMVSRAGGVNGVEPGHASVGAFDLNAAAKTRTSAAPVGAPSLRPVVVDLRARRPVTVKVELEPGTPAEALSAPPLPGKKRNGAQSMEIAIAVRPNGPIVVTVSVPPSMAAGRYERDVIDVRTGRRCGAISISLAR